LLLSVVTLAGCASATHVAAPVATPSVAGTSSTAAAEPTPQPDVVSASPIAVKPRPANRCARNTAAQWVLVSVTWQRAWLCNGSRLVYQTNVTTGAVDLAYDATPTGDFYVEARQTDQTLTLLDGQQFVVKYWIPFSGNLYGFHDAPWQKFAYGSALYRTQGSHGCVHMPLAAMAYLYNWVQVGTKVTVKA
jgi:lipoprotein-anchoring transpeptidase ErfK/SrfK